MSVMVGIDQSHIGSRDKSHGDEPTTAVLQLSYPVEHKSTPAPPTPDHVGSESEHVGVSSPHLKATGMPHHTVTVSLWVTGVEEPLSCL